MSKWTDDISSALIQLGGLSHYSDLYSKIEEIREGKLSENWRAVVRRTIQQHSSDSESFLKKEDLFYTIDGIGSGVWGLRSYIPQENYVDLTEDDISFPEGKKVLRKHIVYERNPKLMIEAKRRFKELYGKLFCEICEFDFEEKYGEIGEDFIEGHHTIPVSEMKDGDETKIEDIVMVCSNCHKMIHRKRPWLSKRKIKQLIR